MRLTYPRLPHLRRVSALTAVVLCAGVLAGCSSEDPQPAAGADSASPAAEATTAPTEPTEDAGERRGSASLDLGEESFFFTLAVCMITDDDVLASGTTSAMTSTDDQRSFSTHAGGEFGFLYVDDRLDVEGQFVTTGVDGTRPGRLTVNCE